MESKGQSTPQFIKVSKEDLVGHYDFEVWDGTLPSDRAQIASSLDELLQQIMANPQIAMSFGIDAKKLLEEMLLLRGVKNPERFNLQSQPPNPNVIEPSNGTTSTPGESGGATAGTQSSIPESLLPLLAGTTVSGGNNGNSGGFPTPRAS